MIAWRRLPTPESASVVTGNAVISTRCSSGSKSRVATARLIAARGSSLHGVLPRDIPKPASSLTTMNDPLPFATGFPLFLK